MCKNERRTVFILAAGLGTRLKELTSDKPKALVELNDKPLIEHVIDKLISQNFNHFVINIHHFGDKIIDFVNNNKYSDIEIDISDERDFLYYTGGAILKALPYFSKSKAVLIHNVDIFTDIDFQPYYDDFINSDDAAWLFTQERDNLSKVAFDVHNNFVGTYNINKFRKLQYSGWIDGKYYFLPPHQQLVDALMKLETNSLVKATRLTQGGQDKDGNFQTAEYEIEVLREGSE